MRRIGAVTSFLAALLLLPLAAGAAEGGAPARIEARSQKLLAVGTVQGDHMIIHLSRIADNAPVSDATVTVILRGRTHPTTAETDGSYALSTSELAIPGTAEVLFEVVTEGGAHETLNGTLEVGAAGHADDKGSSRQIGWWVLNILVCVGFLVLWSRRPRPKAADE